MENIVALWSISALRQGTYAFLMAPKRLLQLVVAADIGAFVAALIERREKVFAKQFDLAGTSYPARSRRKSSRRPSPARSPIRKSQSPRLASKAKLMFEWFDLVGAYADIAALRRDSSEVHWRSFADRVHEFDWSVLERTSSVA